MLRNVTLLPRRWKEKSVKSAALRFSKKSRAESTVAGDIFKTMDL